MARNILGSELIDVASIHDRLYRNGKCDTCGDDAGQHSICANDDHFRIQRIPGMT